MIRTPEEFLAQCATGKSKFSLLKEQPVLIGPEDWLNQTYHKDTTIKYNVVDAMTLYAEYFHQFKLENP